MVQLKSDYLLFNDTVKVTGDQRSHYIKKFVFNSGVIYVNRFVLIN